MATQLLCDGYEDSFDAAVLITNESDLLAPVQLVRDRLRKKVGILNPRQHPARVLKNAATFFKKIREGVLRSSHFADDLQDANGVFRRRDGW